MQVLSTVNLKFYVQQPDKRDLAVDLDVIRIKTNFTVTVDEMQLSGNVTALFVEDLEANFCSYGSVHVNLIRSLIDDILDPKSDMIPTLNEFLAKNAVIKVPDSFGGVFKMSALTLQYHDDYVYLGATPTFIAPQQGAEVDLFPWLSDEAYSFIPTNQIDEKIEEVAEVISKDLSHEIEEAKEVAEMLEKGINGFENVMSIIHRHHLEQANPTA